MSCDITIATQIFKNAECVLHYNPIQRDYDIIIIIPQEYKHVEFQLRKLDFLRGNLQSSFNSTIITPSDSQQKNQKTIVVTHHHSDPNTTSILIAAIDRVNKIPFFTFYPKGNTDGMVAQCAFDVFTDRDLMLSLLRHNNHIFVMDGNGNFKMDLLNKELYEIAKGYNNQSLLQRWVLDLKVEEIKILLKTEIFDFAFGGDPFAPKTTRLALFMLETIASVGDDPFMHKAIEYFKNTRPFLAKDWADYSIDLVFERLLKHNELEVTPPTKYEICEPYMATEILEFHDNGVDVSRSLQKMFTDPLGWHKRDKDIQHAKRMYECILEYPHTHLLLAGEFVSVSEIRDILKKRIAAIVE
jgi:hypothetical protein